MSLPIHFLQSALHFPEGSEAGDLAEAIDRRRNEAIGALVRMWTWCAIHAPRGVIRAIDPARAVERVVEWDGERGAFVTACIATGFLQQRGKKLYVCGWEKRYGHLIDGDEEREKKRAAEKKADAERKREERAAKKAASDARPPDVQVASGERPADVQTPSDGRPTDISLNKEREREEEKEETHVESPEAEPRSSAAPTSVGDAPPSETPAELVLSPSEPKGKAAETAKAAAVRSVFEHWKSVMGHPGAKLDYKRRERIGSRLAQGFTVEDLKLAVDGCARTPHNMGQNDSGKRYDDIELICRDAPHVERFIANATAPPVPKNGASSLFEFKPDSDLYAEDYA